MCISKLAFNTDRLRCDYFDTHNQLLASWDIRKPFFTNGLPVATVELKTDNTQSIDDAVYQYKHDRNPSPKGQASEPLLTFPMHPRMHQIQSIVVHRSPFQSILLI